MNKQPSRPTAPFGAEQQFRLLVQGVTDYAIYMLDPNGRIITWNSGAERIKGYTSKEVIGEHFGRFYTPEDREAGMPEKALQTARERTEAWDAADKEWEEGED